LVFQALVSVLGAFRPGKKVNAIFAHSKRPAFAPSARLNAHARRDGASDTRHAAAEF
jgi:hypothetical protein